MDYPIKVPALRISQPLGDFYITKLPAKVLLDVTFQDPLRVREETDDNYAVAGKQREQRKTKLKEIGQFIDGVDAAFPNSIILSANYNEGGLLIEEEKLRWKIYNQKSGCLELYIPSKERIVSIIDGQHRVYAFDYCNLDKRNMELLCAIYIDLPEIYQAYLFATINYNQTPVPKSLAYELFGVNLESSPAHTWTPEKTAIFLTRKLNMNSDSPFYKHIFISAQQDDIIERKIKKDQKWAVSTATVVDGIMRLYSRNPKQDKLTMHKVEQESRNRSLLYSDSTPLRNMYLESNDLVIYKAVENFFLVVTETLFKGSSSKSYIKKTVGVQALFDFLKEILVKDFTELKDISKEYFQKYLDVVSSIDFSHSFFQASGVGKTRIRNLLLLASSIIDYEDISNEDDIITYKNLLKQ